MVNVNLLTVDDNGHRESFGDSVELFLIGSSEECHLRISDPSVSSMHCAICRHPEIATLMDFGSWPGTMVNGRFFRNGILGLLDQDRLQLGGTEITVGISVEPQHTIEPVAEDDFADWDDVRPVIEKRGSRTVELETNNMVEVVKYGKTTVISFQSKGIPRSAFINDFRVELLELLDTCQTELLGVDLLGIPYIPSALLGVLSSARLRVDELHLYRPSANVRNILQTAKLDQLMRITDAPNCLE